MAALTGNYKAMPETVESRFGTFLVVPGAHCYGGGFAGLLPSGLVRPFVPGDECIGWFYGEANNTDGTSTTPPAYSENANQFGDVYQVANTANTTFSGGASLLRTKQSVAKVVMFDSTVEIRLAYAALTTADIGKVVYATTDNPGDIALVGHPDAMIGRIVNNPLSGQISIRCKRQGEVPLVSDRGSIDMNFNMAHAFANQVTSGGETYVQGYRLDAIGAGITAGAGLLPLAGKSGAITMVLDNDNEAQNITLQTPELFDAAKGLTMEVELHINVLGPTATTDFDFGLMTAASSSITDAIRADMDVATAAIGQLKCHVDGDSANILAGSDDNSTLVANVDTLSDNVTTIDTGYKNFLFIIRPSGIGEIWINKVRVLTTTVFSCIGVLATFWAGIINLEKSTGTNVSVANIRKLRVAGAGPGVVA